MRSANSLRSCLFSDSFVSESVAVGVSASSEVIRNSEFLEMESSVPQFCPLRSDNLGHIAFGKFVLMYTRAKTLRTRVVVGKKRLSHLF